MKLPPKPLRHQPEAARATCLASSSALVLERLPAGLEADDPFDAFLLAMAGAGEAEYLVTRDYRAGLLQRGHIGRTRILTPAPFCSEAL